MASRSTVTYKDTVFLERRTVLERYILCASGSGLIRYDYLENRLQPVSRVNEVSPSVRHLLADRSRFLLATDNSLVIYDRDKGKVLAQVSVQASGISNVCYAIQKDQQGFYWISTNAGLCKVNQKNQLVQTYKAGNGLTFLEYNTACTDKDADGTLYFGGMGGITFFRPESLRPNRYSPQPVITAVRVNAGIPLSWKICGVNMHYPRPVGQSFCLIKSNGRPP